MTHEDEIYLTYSALGKSKDWWGALNQNAPEEAAGMLAARVWEGDNLKTYMAAKKESEMSEGSKAQRKQYVRYMKAQKRKKKKKGE